MPAAVRDRLPAILALVTGVVGASVVLLGFPGVGDANAAWAGFLAGGLVPVAFWHRFRVLGFVPPAAVAGAGLAVYGAATGDWLWVPLAVAGGMIWVVAVGRADILNRPGDPTAFGCAPAAAAAALAVPAAVALTLAGLGGVAVWVLVGAAVGLAAYTTWALFRPFVELATEPILWLMYSVRGTGPGLAEVPARGPCLFVANHACWGDPFLLAKILPRPITPVMTSQFYDRPVISWFMRRVIKAIRVPERPLKQDVPQEIKEVIAALDRGECVVLFPEGYLRRSEDRPLKRFGRGVWQVLTARPDTPVFPCWIEGGWGSYTSYMGGPPTKNKRPDFRRPIRVAVGAPVTIGPDELAHHLATRIDLMNRVAACRPLLGLPEVPAYSLPSRDDDEAAERG